MFKHLVIIASLIFFVQSSAFSQDNPYVVETSIDIYASNELVWNILLDFAKYPEWNPFIQKLEGGTNIGDTLIEHLLLVGPFPIKAPSIVVTNTPPYELAWVGKVFNQELAYGHHQLMVIPYDSTHCLFVQKETFSGAVIPLAFKIIKKIARKKFIEMNEALKKRAESISK